MSRRGVATYNICCVFFCLQFFDYELWKISQFAIKRILQSKPNVRYQRLKESSIKASSQYDGRPHGALHLTLALSTKQQNTRIDCDPILAFLCLIPKSRELVNSFTLCKLNMMQRMCPCIIPYSGKFLLVQIFIHLAKKPTEYIFVCFNFVCLSYKTTPMQLTYGLQHSIVIALQPF